VVAEEAGRTRELIIAARWCRVVGQTRPGQPLAAQSTASAWLGKGKESERGQATEQVCPGPDSW